MLDSDSNTSKSEQPKYVEIADLDELKAWLDAHGIDTSSWGRGEAKPVESLLDEILAGESRLQDDPSLRVISLVQVLIRRGDLVLIETEQELADGRTRPRNLPLAEKIRAGEAVNDAVLRGLKEELGIQSHQVTIRESTYRSEQRDMISQSYPDLKTRYLMHVIEAEVEGLPSDDFVTREASDSPDETVQAHHWSWRPIEKQA